MSHIPWVEAYKPQRVEEIAGNKKAIAQVLAWLSKWERGKIPSKRALLIWGPPGIGKTLLVEVLSKQKGYELVQMNASDWRTADAIRRVSGMASSSGGLFGRMRIILLDEIDGISPQDKGAVREICRIIEKTRHPIILIANDAWDPKLAPLRKYCEMIAFKRLGIRDVVAYLKKFCRKLGIQADDAALRLLAKKCEGDMRSALNDLQAIAEGKKRITVKDVELIPPRDRKKEIFDALRRVFYSSTCRGAKSALAITDLDPDMFFQWIYENAPSQITDPEDLARVMEALAKADYYMRIARQKQMWNLLRYAFDLMTAGVAMARQKSKPKWAKMRFPTLIKELAATKEQRELLAKACRKIGKRCHISSKRAFYEYLPLLKLMVEKDPDLKKKIARSFNLKDEELKVLFGS